MATYYAQNYAGIICLGLLGKQVLSTHNNHLYYHSKIFIPTAEFNELSSAAYKNGIL